MPRSSRARAWAVPALLLLLAAASCSDRVLDTAPVGELNTENFYQTEAEFAAATLAPYSTILNLYYSDNTRGYWHAHLLPDDDVRVSHNDTQQSRRGADEFNWLPGNEAFDWTWTEAYKGIMRANLVLDRLPQARRFASDSNKARFEAEAKFMRAYFYFLPARNFGEVPLVDKTITEVAVSQVANSAPGAVWDLVEADLDFARKNLPATWGDADRGRATKGAAAGLLGKVRLYRAQRFRSAAKYQQAVEAFNEVVAANTYDLAPTYGDNFLETQENNEESVFEVQMSRGDFNPWLPTDFPGNVGAAGSGRVIVSAASCGPTNVCAPGANGHGYGQLHVTEGLQAAFEPGDPRRFFTLYSAGEDYAGQPYNALWSVTGSTPAKYLRGTFKNEGFPPNVSTNNERVLRYADVLLMLAEAELLGNGNVARAASLVNRVRARARASYSAANGRPAPAGLLPDVPAAGAPQAWFRTYLMPERRVEFALEGSRHDDLVRWHRAGLINIKTDVDFGSTIANQNWRETFLLKPVPQTERDVNPNLKQNDGY